MSTFIQPAYFTEHPGVVRAADVAAAMGELASSIKRTTNKEFFSAKGLGTVAIAAAVSAAVFAASQLMDTWTDQHLFAAWVILWTVAFAALALLAAPIRRAARTAAASFAQWQISYQSAADDRAFWESALTDRRVMAEIDAARMRASA